jgi:5-methylcytosine-specific restriction protein A
VLGHLALHYTTTVSVSLEAAKYEMPNLPPSHRPQGHIDREAYDKRRSVANNSLYNHRWRRVSALFRAENALCIDCLADNIITPSAHTDHIVPAVDDPSLLWEPSNWRAFCASCHSKRTAHAVWGKGSSEGAKGQGRATWRGIRPKKNLR